MLDHETIFLPVFALKRKEPVPEEIREYFGRLPIKLYLTNYTSIIKCADRMFSNIQMPLNIECLLVMVLSRTSLKKYFPNFE